ncbi:MAG: hypothetical protein ACO2PN_20020 [Pyrobaculum sp.]
MKLGIDDAALGGRCDAVVVGRSDWVVELSCWFCASSAAAVGRGVPRRCRCVFVPMKVFTRLGWRGGNALKGIRRRAGGRPPEAVRRF